MNVEFSGEVAISQLKMNPERGWTHANANRSANERLNSGEFLDLGHRPKFQLSADWPVFTVGSCFAREIENALIRRQAPVLTEGHGVEGKYFASWNAKTGIGGGVQSEELSRGALNKYTLRSMLHEVDSVLNNKTYPDNGLIQLYNGLWFDPHAAGLRNADFETTSSNRAKIAKSTAAITQAKIVVLTLGLTETWLDKESSMPMNGHPGLDVLARMKDRFYFIDYGLGETFSQLKSMILLINEKIKDVKIILTVSPVPLSVTFKQDDIIVATNGSKAMLRSVAEEARRQFDNVDYFPSYEIVTFSPRKIAFVEDGIHVNAELVKRIMDKFISSYYPA
jgi:GSCFA family